MLLGVNWAKEAAGGRGNVVLYGHLPIWPVAIYFVCFI